MLSATGPRTEFLAASCSSIGHRRGDAATARGQGLLPSPTFTCTRPATMPPFVCGRLRTRSRKPWLAFFWHQHQRRRRRLMVRYQSSRRGATGSGSTRPAPSSTARCTGTSGSGRNPCVTEVATSAGRGTLRITRRRRTCKLGFLHFLMIRNRAQSEGTAQVPSTCDPKRSLYPRQQAALSV